MHAKAIKEVDKEIPETCYELLIESIGEKLTREGLRNTPKRATKGLRELTRGYQENPKDYMTTFSAEGYDQMVLLKDIEFYSLCEHHLLPFFGKAHVAYIPGKKIVGVSKLARIVDTFSRRLQNQERITEQIAKCLNDNLKPCGVAVMLEAGHLCMKMRGVEKQNSVMVTSKLIGSFKSDEKARQEFFNSIKL